MRIAYLSGAYVPGRGADSVHVMRMCDAMAGLGHEVTLHVRQGPEQTDDDFRFYGTKHSFRIAKHARPKIRGVGALAYGGLVARHLSRNVPPDLIYAREIYALRFAAGLKIPIIFESHWKPKHWLQRQLESSIFRLPHFRRAVFISEALRRIYRDEFPWLSASQTVVAHDAADLPSAPQRGQRASSHGRLQVGYVGGFLPGYGLQLIEALARAMPQIDFQVVGGQDTDILDWRSRTHDVPNMTLHGFVAPSQLAERYAQFDVVIAPFQSTTAHIHWISPMKLFEYMSFAKPIICSDFPVMREIIEDGVDGLLASPADLASWQSAIARLKDPALRLSLGERAFRKLSARHTWTARAREVLAGVG